MLETRGFLGVHSARLQSPGFQPCCVTTGKWLPVSELYSQPHLGGSKGALGYLPLFPGTPVSAAFCFSLLPALGLNEGGEWQSPGHLLPPLRGGGAPAPLWLPFFSFTFSPPHGA